MSGAQKRKLAAEKKVKEIATTSKMQKIYQLFSSVPSTSSASSSANTSVEKVDDEMHAFDCEIDSPRTHEESEAESEIISDSGSTEFQTDPALWDIPTNITLQDYWINQGEFKLRLCLKHSKKRVNTLNLFI